MEFTSISSHESTSTTPADNHDYMGHRETASLTTVATTCVILGVVIGVGVAVLFCKRFVESRNSVSEDEDLCPETRRSPSSDDVIDNLYDPPKYDDVIANDSSLVSTTPIVTQKLVQIPANGRTVPVMDETRYHLISGQSCSNISGNGQIIGARFPTSIETPRQSPVPSFVKRKINRSTSETLVYIPCRLSWSEQDSNANGSKTRVHNTASKSCNDIDELPSYEDAVKLCQHTFPES